MKKYNSLLIVVLLSSIMSSFISSKDTKQSFIESAKKDFRVASVLYSVSYGVVHGFGSLILAPLHAWIEADFERWEAKKNSKKISFRKTVDTFGKEFKDAFYDENKEIFRSHRIMAPVVLSGVVAHNVYKNVTHKN